MRSAAAVLILASLLCAGCIDIIAPDDAFEIEIGPAEIVLTAIGDTARFDVSAKDKTDHALAAPRIAWSSSDPTVVMVDATGRLTARSDGKAEIRASSDWDAATATLTVRRVAASIVISGGGTLTSLQATTALTALAVDRNGSSLDNVAVTWSSANPDIAIVSSSGIVRAQRPGTATIYATSGQISGSIRITVTHTVSAFRMLPAATVTLTRLGEPLQLTAMPVDSDGLTVFENTPTITWSSSRPDVATVSASGVVIAVANGTTTIRATGGGISATATITVARQSSYVVDQQQPSIDLTVGGILIGSESNKKLAQVVTAGRTGKLVEVSFPLSCERGDLVVEIQGVTNGLPNGTVRSHTVVSGETLFWSWAATGFSRFKLDSAVSLTSGERYAIVLSSGGSCGIYRGAQGDTYAGGAGYHNALPNAGWVLIEDRNDLPFITWMEG